MAENPSGVRSAVPHDFDALLAFAMGAISEGAAQAPSLNKVAVLVEKCVYRNGGIAGIVSGPDGTIEASVGALLESFDYSDEMHLSVKWLGVAEPFRKTDRNARVLTFLKWLYETMSAVSGVAIPVFLQSAVTTQNANKLITLRHRMPAIGMMLGFGDTQAIDPVQFAVTDALRRQRNRDKGELARFRRLQAIDTAARA